MYYILSKTIKCAVLLKLTLIRCVDLIAKFQIKIGIVVFPIAVL